MEPNEPLGGSTKIRPVEPVEQKSKKPTKVAAAEALAELAPISYSETAKADEIVRSDPIETAKQVSVSSLIASKAVGDVSDAAAIAWLETAAKTLQRALVGWQLQAKVLGTRLTPNAGLIRLLGSDRLEAKDIENNRQRLLTTLGPDAVAGAQPPVPTASSGGRSA